MPTPHLLVDGRPRPAALFLTVHEAFRRDAARFAASVASPNGPAHRQALVRHWELYEGMLVSHHTQEDSHLFPALATRNPHLAQVIEELEAEHGELHALLDHIGQLLGALPKTAATAADAFVSLRQLLERHLGKEEEHLVPAMEAAGLAPTGEGGDDERHVPAWWEALVVPWAADGLGEAAVQAIFIGGLAEALTTQRSAYLEHVAATWSDGELAEPSRIN